MIGEQKTNTRQRESTTEEWRSPLPSISLPKGGGALRGIGEKFAATLVTGAGNITVPLAVSPGRQGFSPQLTLTYDSGAGNGAFGLGWNLPLPSISRRTDKGLPLYQDADESDVFILSGAEDLVPVLIQNAQGEWVRDTFPRDGYAVTCYRPRIEGLFSRIERWTRSSDGDTYWRSISKDNVTTFYGKTRESRISDPNDPSRIFSWLICESFDGKGNAIVYEYVAEDSANIDPSHANERNRINSSRSANRYLKRIKYGNTPSRLVQSDLTKLSWLFEVVLDYGESHYVAKPPDAQGREFVTASRTGTQPWPVRQDPFSRYRARFEVRTYRLCRRVLMFHHFPIELGVPDYLVRGTEFTYRESPIASFIVGVTQSGFVLQDDGTYLKRSLPTLEFEYSQAQVQQVVRDVDPESFADLPSSVDGLRYRWLDLDGEGLQCVLAEQDGGWYYKRNLSPLTSDYKGGQPTFSALFETFTEVTRLPAFAEATAPRHQFVDLAGDGHLDCVVLERPVAGFYKRTEEKDWETFAPLPSEPNVDWNDPNLRFIDLDGDGHTDILITEDEVLTWYRSLAEAGFGAPVRVTKARDEEEGPAIIFADGTQSIFLADMSGDGLTDIVRIRNGEVCYWPNLGYGQFGRKVTMDQSPCFDTPDLFDPRRIRLADVDGSATTDIIYLASDGVRLYFNESGNLLSEPETLAAFPPINNLSTVHALDLLGNGTACLVWMSSLPGDAQHSMRYVDLMGGEKPHLLIRTRNNLGAETRVFYAPSTKFYLADRQAKQPCVTRLPFPVQVVERVETYDWVSRNRFVTRYAYHHGYYDGIEREFRGFGMVEQWDTEEVGTVTQRTTPTENTNWNAAAFVPPVLVRTWFHTGRYIAGGRISKLFEHEYYREGDASRGETGLTDQQLEAMLLDDTVLPVTIRHSDGTQIAYVLSGEESREACRSLKGAILRQEIYGLDSTDEANRPYSVSERNYTIELLQPRAQNLHAVFFTHARETVDFHYERKIFNVGGNQHADPRVSHALTLEVDNYGNVLQSVTIGYGRRFQDSSLPLDGQKKQKNMLVTFTENAYTNPVLEADAYRAPLLCESRTYQVLNLALDPLETLPDITNLFRFADVSKQIKGANDGNHDLPYEDINHTQATTSNPYRRLIEHVRTLYRSNDLSGLLPLGEVQSQALPGESYKLAFTPGLLAQVFRRNGQALLPTAADVLGRQEPDGGGYVDLDGSGHWWIPSGREFYSPTPIDSPAQELAFARDHFFLPHRYRDPFGKEVIVNYDSDSVAPSKNHNLLLVETKDPLGNIITVKTQDDNGNIAIRNDYRVLQPYWVTDQNHNRTWAAFDAHGMVVATAVMGKPGENKGDNLVDFVADLTQAQIDAFHEAIDPHGVAATLLKGASTRIIYDLRRFHLSQQAHPEDSNRWEPAYAAVLGRETHARDSLPPQGLKIQISFTYSDGFGREIQKKVQAKPGPVPRRDANGKIIVGTNGQPVMTANDSSPRWVGSGWTVFNNKGSPVRRFEPFFTDTHHFDSEVRIGASTVLFYDSVERVIGTLNPNHSWGKEIFDPWQQETWDVNDTVLISDPKTDADVGAFFSRLPDSDYLPTWHALRTDPLHVAEFAALYPDTTDLSNETNAAAKSATHAGTPATAYFDTLARTFLTIAENRFMRNNILVEERYSISIEHDIEGNQRKIIDAKDRIVMRYDYDMLSNRINQFSMEAGERWILNDVTGKPIRAWDSRDHRFRSTYDALRRPTDSFLREGGGVELLVGRSVYGETHRNPETSNLRGKVVQLFDQAGIVSSDEYDFKGNLLRSQRQLSQAYKSTLDWSAVVPLDARTFVNRTRYDALNRPIQVIAAHSDQAGTKVNIIQPIYNDTQLLERVRVWLNQESEPMGLLDPMTASLRAVTKIDYNAKCQRNLIDYGNGVRTTYSYDSLTFRLMHLLTRRDPIAFPEDCPDPAPAGWPGCQVQSLHYTYDPVGNITHIRDDAQQTVYFRNKRVEPSADYVYDAIYRLIEATGREHLGQIRGAPIPHFYNDAPRVGVDLSANDGNAMGTYIEHYVYDAVGNLLEMQHRGTDPENSGWTRTYAYNKASLIEPGKNSNRLSGSTVGNHSSSTEQYAYDSHGNMLHMAHLQLIQWDFKDQLQMTQRQAVNPSDTDGLQHQGERTYYIYDSAGQRARKVTELTTGQVKEERIYLGGFEIYHKNGVTSLVRETLHVMDDKQRIALVETRIQGNDPAPRQLIRYQLSDHLGSASLELDDQARLISYEEYTPFGSTSYQAVRSQVETPKRYRYTGKERDEENGLYYHGKRYYAPWLGRWTATDPSGINDGLNLYQYVSNNPVRLTDPLGRGAWDRVWGGVKMVGGALETAAGGALIAAGAATSEIGIGIVIAGAGVLVTAHGADVTVSGARTLWNGAPVDTLTSNGLQAAGMSRTAANLTDAGISIVGTFGAGALTRAPGVAATVADSATATEGASQTANSVSLAFKPGVLGPGHNMVGVTTEAGTEWTHLVVSPTAESSGVVTSGASEVVTSTGPSAAYTVTTVPVTAARAEAALATARASVGTVGEYALTANDCATHAASVLRAAGVVTPPLTTPAVNFISVALQSPAVVGPISASGAAVNVAVEANVLYSSDAPGSSIPVAPTFSAGPTQAVPYTPADSSSLVCTPDDVTEHYDSMVCRP